MQLKKNLQNISQDFIWGQLFVNKLQTAYISEKHSWLSVCIKGSAFISYYVPVRGGNLNNAWDNHIHKSITFALSGISFTQLTKNTENS